MFQKEETSSKIGLLAGIDNKIAKGIGTARVSGELACEAEIMFAIIAI